MTTPSIGAIAQSTIAHQELSEALSEWLDSLDTDSPTDATAAIAAMVAAIREDQAKAIDAIADLNTAIDADIAAAEAGLAVWTEFYRRRIASLKGQQRAIEIQWLRLVDSGVLPESLPGRLSKAVITPSTVVVVEDVKLLDERYLRPRDPDPNKVEIKRAFDAGEVVEGAVLEKRRSLKFKPMSQRDRARRSV